MQGNRGPVDSVDTETRVDQVNKWHRFDRFQLLKCHTIATHEITQK